MLFVFTLLLTLLSLSLAAPVQLADNAARKVPGVTELTKVSENLESIIHTIGDYFGDPAEAREVIQKSSEALMLLDKAAFKVEHGPGVEVPDSFGYLKVATTLVDQVKRLADVLTKQKKVIVWNRLGPNVYQILDIGYAEITHFFKVLRPKAPSYVRGIITGYERVIVDSFGKAREVYKEFASQVPRYEATPYQWTDAAPGQAAYPPPPAAAVPVPEGTFQQQPAQPSPPYSNVTATEQQAQPAAQPEPQTAPQPPSQPAPPGYAWSLMPLDPTIANQPPAPQAAAPKAVAAAKSSNDDNVGWGLFSLIPGILPAITVPDIFNILPRPKASTAAAADATDEDDSH